MSEPVVVIRLPLSHWNQIVSDIENMCGTSAENIEILQQVAVIGTDLQASVDRMDELLDELRRNREAT